MMEKAKQLIRDLQPQYEQITEQRPDDLENLKVEVNNILHMYLPSDITVGQMEALAETIHHIIINPKDYLLIKKL